MDRVSGSINLPNSHFEVTVLVELHKGVRGEDEQLTFQFPVLFVLLFAEDADQGQDGLQADTRKGGENSDTFGTGDR